MEPASSETDASPSSAWHIPEYRRLWLGTVVMALATQAERLAVSWVVLLKTDSVFLTAASFAIRKVPGSLVAPVAGDISDRLSRSRLLAATALYNSVIVLLLAYLSLDGFERIGAVFILAALSGIGRSFETPATQGLITDTVPKAMTLQAVALQSTGAKAVGALGSLLGGMVISTFGAPAALFAGTGVLLIGAAIIATMPRSYPRRRAAAGTVPGILLEAARGLSWLIARPVVGALLWAAFVVEIFGFAYNALLPSVARDVLSVDADGLGALTFTAGVGAMIGVAALAAVGNSPQKGLLFVEITVAYGVILAAFALSGSFSLSLALIVGVGATAAMFDTMQWTLLQQHVPDDVRGRAIGGWVFAINFAWIGQLAMGAVAEAIGVQWAMAGSAGLVILTGLAAYLLSPGLRTV